MIGGGIILLIIFSPLAFGSVETWAYSIIEIIVVFITLTWFIKIWIKNSIKNKDDKLSSYKFRFHYLKTPINLPILVFIAFILLQIIPMPEFILRAVSPNTYEIYSESQNAINKISDNELSFKSKVGFRSLSLNHYATKNEIYKIIAYFLLFFLIVNNINNYKKIRRIFASIVIFAFFLSLFAIIQQLTWNGKIYWFRVLRYGGEPFGPYINHNHYAGYMEMVIPLAIGFIFHIKDINKKILLGFITMVMTASVFMTLSRAGMISLICSFLFLLVMLMLKKNLKSPLKMVVFFIFISSLIFLIYLGVLDDALNEIFTLTDSDLLSQQNRPWAWKDSLNILKDFPIFGSGLGTFGYIFPQYRSFYLQARYAYAHNDYLQALVECGVLGFSIVLWGIIAFSRAAFKYSKKDNISLCLLTSVVAIGIHSFFDFNLHIPANAIMLVIIISLLISWNYIKNKHKSDFSYNNFTKKWRVYQKEPDH